MIINGIDLGIITPIRLSVRPSQATAKRACDGGFNEVVDKCCPGVKGKGLDEEGRYILTSDPEISLADMLRAGVDLDHIVWSFDLLEGPESERTMRLFAAACAAEVLPIFETKHRGDDRPRAAIEAAVGFAHGTVTQNQLIAAQHACNTAAKTIWYAIWDFVRPAFWSTTEYAITAAQYAHNTSLHVAWKVDGDAGVFAAMERQRQILAAFLE